MSTVNKRYINILSKVSFIVDTELQIFIKKHFKSFIPHFSDEHQYSWDLLMSLKQNSIHHKKQKLKKLRRRH